MKQRRKKSQGFSLVEMAMVIAVLGVVTGSVLSLSASHTENTNLQSLDDKMTVIDNAIAAYIKRNNVLPCPATRTAAQDSAAFGRSTNCSAAAPAGTTDTGSGTDIVRIGALPVRSLMLPDSYAYDPWGSRFTFAIIRELGKTTTTLDTYQTSLTNGVINITDINGNQMSEAAVDSIVSYVVVSHGSDRKGAYAPNGAITVACGSTKDSENCDNDNVFIDSDITDTADPSNASYYYDKIHWKLLSGLIGVQNADDSVIFMNNGWKNSCIIRAKGAAYCIGYNNFGQVGDGTTVDKTVYTQVGGAGGYTDWRYISTDNQFTCGIRGMDEIWCWGINTSGELGDNTTVSKTTPVAISVAGIGGTNAGWTSLDIDDHHACGIRGGHLYCWGANDKGQLGVATAPGADELKPKEVLGGYSDWVSVGLGVKLSCGIRNQSGNYKAYCWGQNTYGGLGDGTTTDKYDVRTLSAIGGFTDMSKVGSEDDLVCGLRGNGQLWCWGRNTDGGVGNNTSGANVLSPVQVKDDTGASTWSDWSDFEVDYNTVCGIRAGGKLYCWGKDNMQQLGNGAPTADVLLPQEVTGAYTDWKSVAVSGPACGLRSGKDQFYCWGRNDFGQLGLGTTTNMSVPTLVTAY